MKTIIIISILDFLKSYPQIFQNNNRDCFFCRSQDTFIWEITILCVLAFLAGLFMKERKLDPFNDDMLKRSKDDYLVMGIFATGIAMLCAVTLDMALGCCIFYVGPWLLTIAIGTYIGLNLSAFVNKVRVGILAGVSLGCLFGISKEIHNWYPFFLSVGFLLIGAFIRSLCEITIYLCKKIFLKK